jgi:peptidyl-prolyl cis-trans isomerase SurA
LRVRLKQGLADGKLVDEMTFGNFTKCRRLLAASMAAGTTLAQTVRVIAASEAVTELEIQQRSRLTQSSTRQTPSREEVIDELRKEKLKVQEAREFGVEVSDSEVDAVYATMASRMRLTSEQLTEQLARSGVHVDTLKHRIRADMAWGKYKQRQRLQQDPPPPGRDNG